MKKLKFILFPIVLFTPILFVAAAETDTKFTYTPMEAIPFFGRESDFCTYIDFVYKFGLYAIPISALLMIAIGGFMYSTSAGNNASMEKAKGVITDALIGLLLALVGWLVLYLINPDLTFCKIGKVNTVEVNADGNIPASDPEQAGLPIPKTIEERACEEDARDYLEGIGVKTNRNGKYCETDQSTQCTDICYEGEFKFRDKILKLSKSESEGGCNIKMITGGTEKAGHSPTSMHYVGRALDMHTTAEQAACIRDNRASFGGTQICSWDQVYAHKCTNYTEPNEITHLTF